MSPNEPKPATPEAQALLRAAGRDWKTVELLLQHHDAPVSSVGFHAQQYLEKVIKAVLVSNAVIFRRTHDLEELADLLERQGIEPPLPKDQLRRLNPFAVIIRYQDIEITLTDINTVAEMMEHVHAWVERQIYE
ncbi:MAG: HEPN domain-containing protein [Anaerolineae bacterium]